MFFFQVWSSPRSKWFFFPLPMMKCQWSQLLAKSPAQCPDCPIIKRFFCYCHCVIKGGKQSLSFLLLLNWSMLFHTFFTAWRRMWVIHDVWYHLCWNQSLVNQRFCLELFQVWHTCKSPIETTLWVCTIRKYIPLTLIKQLESRNKLLDSRWRKWKLCLLLSKILFSILLKSISH